MHPERSILPHTKIDWKISDLTQKSARTTGNMIMLIQLMKLHLSKAMFHDGGEADCAHILRHGKRLLQEDADQFDALAMMALALVYLGRQEESWKYLARVDEQETKSELVHLALGVYYKANNHLEKTIEHWTKALEATPKAWELHRLLGKAFLLQYHDEELEKAHQQRLGQRSLYHLIQALQSRGELEMDANFLKELGYACMINARNQEAERYFNRLRALVNSDETSYYLGRVAFELGKYNNAVQHFRQFLSKNPDHTDIIAKMAQSWFNLGEYERARQTAHQCLTYEPYQLDARLILGRSLVHLGDLKEATRIFQETLHENPAHIESFEEIVSLRLYAGDIQWIQRQILWEVENYASIPSNAQIDLAQIARQRIGAVLGALMQLGAEMIPVVLDAINCSQDEHLRFALWEVAVYMTQTNKAVETGAQLDKANINFGLDLGCSALSAADLIDERALLKGLHITEEDIRNAALQKYDPAYDVQKYRQNEDRERQFSRGHQALVLLAIAKKGSESARALLREWANQPDVDMSVAAKIGLALNGEVSAFDELQHLTQTTNRKRLLKNIRSGVFHHVQMRTEADFLFSETEQCQICGQTGKGVHHFIRSPIGGICNHCVQQSTQAPAAKNDAICIFCNRNFFISKHITHYQDQEICSTCQNQSQQLVERSVIEQYFHNRTVYFEQ